MYFQVALSLCLVVYVAAFTSQTSIALHANKSKSMFLRKNSARNISMASASCAIKAVTTGAVLIVSNPAFAGDFIAGEKNFNANCAACHAHGQNIVVTDHTLEKTAIEKYLLGGFKESAVVTQVTNGYNAMPAFGGRLSLYDIENVATYVITTSEEDNWE
jgi:cytochrome c6